MSTQLIQPYEGKKWVADHAIISNAWIMLFKNNYTPTSATTLADLTEADYSGYSHQSQVFSAAANDGSDNAEKHTGAVTFTHSGGGTSNTIYGVAIVNDNAGFGTKVLGVYRFVTPVSMASLADSIAFTQLQLLQGQFPL